MRGQKEGDKVRKEVMELKEGILTESSIERT